MIVVDASLAVKVPPEAGEEAAAKLLGGKKRLIAPLFGWKSPGQSSGGTGKVTYPEKKARRRARMPGSVLQHRVVRLVPDAGLFDDAVQMAFLAKHTLTACTWRRQKGLDAPVITADKPMRERGTRAYKNIMLLGGVEGHLTASAVFAATSSR